MSVTAHRDAMARARHLYGPRLAENFRILSFLRTDENKLSQLIAFLLDPEETHEQGSAFLEAFLDHIGWQGARAGLDEARIRLENATDLIAAGRRRMDLLATFGRSAVAIENKPWAADQKGQLRDYFQHLDATRREEFCLIYLTPKGAPPSASSIEADERDLRLSSGQLRLMTYEGLCHWLARCRSICRAPRVTHFLEEFEWLVRSYVLGEAAMEDQEHLLGLMLRSPENVAAALQIAAATPLLKIRLLKPAADLIQEEVKRVRGWEFVSTLDDASYPGIYVTFAGGELSFGFEFADLSLDRPYYGLTKENGRREDGRVYEALSPVFGKAHREGVWPWWRWASPDDHLWPLREDWTSEKPWLEIGDGRAFAAAFLRLASLADQALSDAGLIEGVGRLEQTS